MPLVALALVLCGARPAHASPGAGDDSVATPVPARAVVAPAADSVAVPVPGRAPAVPPRDSLTPLVPVRSSAALPADSLAVRFEVGASADGSNELFYEQSYTDTTFLGRRLHGTPESRGAGVAAMELTGARGSGRWQYTLRPELTLGDAVTRAVATGTLRFRPDPRWRLAFEPRAEYSRDLSFDLDRRELVLASTASALRRFSDDVLDLRLGGELLQTPASRDPFLLAHRVGRGVLDWDHDGILGLGWDLRYEADVRTFPDSTLRDHQEHQVELSARRDFSGGHALTMLAGLTRRSTLYSAPGTRDRFTEARAEVRGTWRFDESYSCVAGVEGDGYRYDDPDSLVDFDYTIVRAEAHVRRDFAGRAWLSAGPRLEWLAAPWNPSERYREFAAAVEFEFLGTGRWWLLGPAIGRRGYEVSESGQSTDPNAIHSTYLFAELQVLGDQSLPGRLRARITANVRLEKHDDPSQDARSLYFSLDLRRLF